MQLGKPVIATAAYGIEDYVEDGFTGILINNNEIDECFESFVFRQRLLQFKTPVGSMR